MKKVLVFLWNKLVDIKIDSIKKAIIYKDKSISLFLVHPKVESIDETLKKIIENRSSVSRYGDGEFKLMSNLDIQFQKNDSLLSTKLNEILLNKDDNFLVCLPDVFTNLDIYGDEPKKYWKLHLAKYRIQWYKRLDKNKIYYNAFISRCYYAFKDKSKCKVWFDSLRLIWKDREVVLIEGKKSRLGIGNDLFDEAKIIERILVPERDAFSKYNEILNLTKKFDQNKLILLAIGPTATVLSYDLYKLGYQAIDIGHVDIEYEWFLRKAKSKIKIENKYVGEAIGGQIVGDLNDKKYLNEIKYIID